MKRITLIVCVFWLGWHLAMPLFADEAFVLKKREWKSVYSAEEKTGDVSSLSFPQIRSLINAIKQNKSGGIDSGSLVEIRGYFKAEAENSFRLTEDDYGVSEFCDSCRKKVAQESPRVIAPPETIEGLVPGLVRVRGKIKIKWDPSQKFEPLIVVDAESISISDTSAQ